MPVLPGTPKGNTGGINVLRAQPRRHPLCQELRTMITSLNLSLFVEE